MPWKRAPSCATGPQGWTVCSVSCATQNFHFDFCGSIPRDVYSPSMPACLQPRVRILYSVALFVVAGTLAIPAQTAPPPAPPNAIPAPGSASTPTLAPCEAIRPLSSVVASAVDAVDVGHWKLSRQGKFEIQGDIDSIRRDISGPLPALLDQAKAKPTELAPQWSVVENVNALYDVLVRVTTTATLAASRPEAALLAETEDQLAAARKNLTEQLVAATGSQDKNLAVLRTQLAAMAASEMAARSQKIIVENSTPRRPRPPIKKARRPFHAPAPGRKLASSKPPASKASGSKPSGSKPPVNKPSTTTSATPPGK